MDFLTRPPQSMSASSALFMSRMPRPDSSSDDNDEFNERLVQDLVKRLDGPVQIPVSSSDKAHLAAIIEGTFEVRWTDTSQHAKADVRRPISSDELSISVDCGTLFLSNNWQVTPGVTTPLHRKATRPPFSNTVCRFGILYGRRIASPRTCC